MRPLLTTAVLTALLASGIVGCHSTQPDMSKTNRLNADTSTGNSQQATVPPTNPNGAPTTGTSPMQP